MMIRIFLRLNESAKILEYSERIIVGASRIKPIKPKARVLSVMARIFPEISQKKIWLPIHAKVVPSRKKYKISDVGVRMVFVNSWNPQRNRFYIKSPHLFGEGHRNQFWVLIILQLVEASAYIGIDVPAPLLAG